MKNTYNIRFECDIALVNTSDRDLARKVGKYEPICLDIEVLADNKDDACATLQNALAKMFKLRDRSPC